MLTWSLLFSVLSGLLLVSCNDDDDDDDFSALNIVEFVQGDDNFSALEDAIFRAGLEDDLSASANYTVFAPDNDAFNDFLNANGFNSVDDIPVDVLESVLLNHVLGARLFSTDLSNFYVTTLSPSGNDNEPLSMYINTDNGVVINGQATVTAADAEVSNGVIHVVDAVIGLPDVTTFAAADPGLNTLVDALNASQLNTNLIAALQAAGPFTVFAPTNQAFENLIAGNDDWNGLGDIPGTLLETVLLYHVSDAGNVRSDELTDDMSVPTLAGENFTIDLDPANPTIQAGQNTAQIIFTDVQATNGVVHVIDNVILP